MEQRDYILREIEKISVLILGLLGRLKRAPDNFLFEQERESVSGEFESAVGMNINDVIASDIEDLPKLLSNEKGFDFRNMELLADLLEEFSSNMEAGEQKMAIEKAVFLLETVDKEGKEFSFDRQIKLNEFRAML